MGIAVSLEAGTPFLDHRMMELAFKIPGNLKLRGGVTKYILKKTVAPLVGNKLAYRSKQMFTVQVGDYCRDSMDSNSYGRLQDIFSNRGALLLEKHIGGTENYAREIRALFAFEHWVRAFKV